MTEPMNNVEIIYQKNWVYLPDNGWLPAGLFELSVNWDNSELALEKLIAKQYVHNYLSIISNSIFDEYGTQYDENSNMGFAEYIGLTKSEADELAEIDAENYWQVEAELEIMRTRSLLDEKK